MKLVNQGRAKAYGVSWNEEEAIARSKGVSAEDIRSGAWKFEVPKEELKEEPKVEEKVEEPKVKRVRKPKK